MKSKLRCLLAFTLEKGYGVEEPTAVPLSTPLM